MISIRTDIIVLYTCFVLLFFFEQYILLNELIANQVQLISVRILTPQPVPRVRDPNQSTAMCLTAVLAHNSEIFRPK